MSREEGQGGGFTIVGSPGTDVAVSFSGSGKESATVKKVRGGGTWGAGAVGTATVTVDDVREVL